MDKDSVFLKSGAFSYNKYCQNTAFSYDSPLTVTAFSFLAVARNSISLIFSDLLKPRAPLWRHAPSGYR